VDDGWLGNGGAPVVKVRLAGNGAEPGSSLWLWCPACDDAHRIVVGTTDSWSWDGNEDAPTISPSILVRGVQWAQGSKFLRPGHPGVPTGGQTVCHSFIVAGVWQFLGDCTHALVGHQVPMVELPDWLDDEYVQPPS
jgi:hypothetical protein